MLTPEQELEYFEPAEFNSFDIATAYYQIEVDYNDGGWLQERPSNQRRAEATHIQLNRLKFSPGTGWAGYASLTDNGKTIYRNLMRRYEFFKPVHICCVLCGRLTGWGIWPCPDCDGDEWIPLLGGMFAPSFSDLMAIPIEKTEGLHEAVHSE